MSKRTCQEPLRLNKYRKTVCVSVMSCVSSLILKSCLLLPSYLPSCSLPHVIHLLSVLDCSQLCSSAQRSNPNPFILRSLLVHCASVLCPYFLCFALRFLVLFFFKTLSVKKLHLSPTSVLLVLTVFFTPTVSTWFTLNSKQPSFSSRSVKES